MAFAPAVYFVHAWQVEGNADKLKERAEAAEAEGEFEKALQLYGQYLNFREDDFDTLLYYLRLRDGMASTGDALSRVLLGYEELLRRDPVRPDDAEIREDIIAVAMALGENSLALYHLETLLDQDAFQTFRSENPQQVAELRFQKGQCHEAEGRIAEAISEYLQALDLEKADHKYYLPLAQLFVNQTENLPERDEAKTPETQVTELTLSAKIRDQFPRKQDRNFSGNDASEQILNWMVENAKSPAQAYLARAQYHYLRANSSPPGRRWMRPSAIGGRTLKSYCFRANWLSNRLMRHGF